MSERELDLVLFGATGFTGRLVAEYLAGRRAGVRWALAGRSREKLASVRDALAAIDPSRADLPILVADSADAAALADLARRTRVVCTTVGPYAKHGGPLVGACAEAGTHYCDITGETLFIRAMIDAWHDRARDTGARIVHACGFDSIPSDLGVLLAHEHLRASGKQIARARYRLVHASGGVSGGTAASLIGVIEAARDAKTRRVLGDPYSLLPRGAPRGADRNDAMGFSRDARTGRWAAPFVMAAINTRVVRRSNALLGFAYGEGFRYEEVTDTGRGWLGGARAVGLTAGIGAFVALASLPGGPSLLARVLPSSGEGPSKEQRERGRFRVEIDAEATDGTRVTAVVVGRADPGYGETAKMLGETALALAAGEGAPAGGVLNSASALGDALIARLRGAGMTFEVKAA